jgi:hypothetical protein
MQQEQSYVLLKTFSVTPSRLSIYNTKVNLNPENKTQHEPMTREQKDRILSNLYGGTYVPKLRHHEFKLSESGRKNLMLKINWLYFMAKARYKKTISGVEIHNFKMNFMTLTLPSHQVHPTSEITKIIFGQFLVELREKYNLTNYVWRLEFQRNQNVHYHLVTDTYTDYFIVQKIWNRCCAKLGYTQAYQRKHMAMSLMDYVRANDKGGTVPFIVLSKRYAIGKYNNWNSPNSVDCVNVSNGKTIAFYISKYFAKKGTCNNAHNPLDTLDNSLGMRLWYCSQSLSKLKRVSDFIEAGGVDLLKIVTAAKDTFIVVHDFCVSYFYNFSKLLPDDRGVMHRLLYGYAQKQGYIPDKI